MTHAVTDGLSPSTVTVTVDVPCFKVSGTAATAATDHPSTSTSVTHPDASTAVFVMSTQVLEAENLTMNPHTDLLEGYSYDIAQVIATTSV